MRVERSLTPAPEDEHCFKVSHWKWEPDPTAPWWQHIFFHWAYLPFQNFSLQVFNIPSVMEVIIESDEQGKTRRIFRWFEDGAVFDDEDQADLACLTEHHSYRKTLKNRVHPSESTQTFGSIFPRKKKPHKWARPTFRLFAKDRRKEDSEQKLLKKYIARIDQALD
jgi:hypothetical protein